jgi:Rrf2 family protein
MALISKSSEYGLRAAMYVAAQEDRAFISIGEISRELNISFHFLTKILQLLTQNGIMKSTRGPSGGVALAKAPRKISLLDIMKAIEGADLFKTCVLGLEGCGSRNPCPLHQAWSVERKRLEKMFRGATLDKLSGPIALGELRLGN